MLDKSERIAQGSRRLKMASQIQERSRTLAILAVAASVALVTAAALTAAPPANANDLGSSVYTRTSSTESMAYDRTIRLEHSGTANGTLLSTFEHWNTTTSPAALLIRKSADNGSTWSTAASLTDPLTGTDHPSNQIYQPFLFEFPTSLGSYPAGSLILIANIAPSTDVQTNFVMWRSSDHGSTWTYQQTLQTGGGSTGAPNGGSGVWEPFVMVNGSGQLAMFFSDERKEPTYAQVVAHTVSNDGGDTWSAKPDGSTNFSPGLVVDVASTSSTDRPGMPTVATLPSGNEVLAYEICGTGRNCEAHTKTSSDGGSTWGTGASDLGTEAVTGDGRYLGSSPFIVWSPAGGPDGELLLTGMRTRYLATNAFTQEDRQAIFVNTDNGTGNWSWTPAPFQPILVSGIGCAASYSPDLLLGRSGTSVRYTTATAVGSTGCMEGTGEANAGVLPYVSTFDGGQAGWINYGGCWSTSSGVLSESCGGSNGNKSLAGSTGWSDYTLAGDVRLDSGTQAGFIVRASDPSVGADTYNGYYVAVTATQLVLGKENGSWTALANATIPGGLSGGTWYHVTVQAIGCTFTVSGVPSGSTATPISLTYTDTGCFTSGSIGVRDQSSTASWRNIVVTAGGLTTSTPTPYLAPFDSGSTSGWTPYGGTWAASGSPGAYSDSIGGAGDKSVTGSSSWTNYAVAGDVSLGNVTGNAGLLVRVTSPAVGVDSLNGYFIGVNQSSIFLGRETNSWTMLQSTSLPVPLANNTWYRLVAQVSGCTVSVTGVPSTGGESAHFSYTDTGCTTTGAGAIGVRTYNTTAQWRFFQAVQN
ncbi:family 16 glycoside hydrolase [Leifsonia sp. 22587]|uniref:family 16 glycoside hydrolase n=1 Tax=Leifsonia sp. 22587 TaxID=3453946 RepID=UPI003F844471